jgi:hypothetical protein
VSSHHPPRFSAFLPGIAFSCEKICANCKNSPPTLGKSRRTNTPPRINQKKGKSGERKGGTLTKTRAKRYVPDVVGKVALVTLLVLQEYFY